MKTTEYSYDDAELKQYTASIEREIKKRSDKLMNYFLLSFFCAGLLLAFYFDTWLIAIGVGGVSLLAYYSVKFLFAGSNLYQYVLSVVLALFMAQYIYQMHGLFEMHFFAFIGSAVLITYQNWKLQIPMLVVVALHHGILGYLQNSGMQEVYFTQVPFFDLQTFVIHIILAGIIFFTCGLWSYQLKKYNEKQAAQTLAMTNLQKEAILMQERRRNEEALELAYLNAEKARMEAEQANQAKSIFLATMSHEIRTPMNGVMGMASLLAETRLNEQQRQYTETIATCGESLLNVINDILDFSKIESGNMELEWEDFNLRNCIEDVLDIFGTRAAQSGIDLLYKIEDGVPEQIMGDDLRLRQIITNLIGNALKFTHKGEVFVGVKLAEQSTEDEVVLRFEVRDTGIGIPSNKLERLFRAFSQVDSSTTRKYGGTGLGLAISEKLVKLMEGEIGVDSVPQEGSTFYFTIKTAVGKKVLQQYVKYNMADHKGKKILVVDDNATNRAVLKGQLENWNLVPVLAESGEEVLALLAAGKEFDLVLTDMQMPLIDGVELAREIKTRNEKIPVILLSSIGDEFNRSHTGLFHAVLTKPVRQHVLNKQILSGLQPAFRAESESARDEKMSSSFAVNYPMSILVAEDNLINQQVIMQILSRLGYAPAVVENGAEAVEAVQQTEYDLVLMDMQMPEMDGIEATELIRKNSTHQPAIIALTANTLQNDQERCMKAGMNDYLAKPIKLDELMQMLQKWYIIGVNQQRKKSA